MIWLILCTYLGTSYKQSKWKYNPTEASIYILPSIQMRLQTFEYFFMALKVVLQDCNGFSNNQRKGTTKEVFSAYMWSKPKSFKWCIWTIKSISSYIWLILVRQLNGLNWFLKVHSLWKKPLTECLRPSQQPTHPVNLHPLF